MRFMEHLYYLRKGGSGYTGICADAYTSDLQTVKIINELLQTFILRKKSLHIKQKVCTQRCKMHTIPVTLEKFDADFFFKRLEHMTDS
jgi:hypothetical protein